MSSVRIKRKKKNKSEGFLIYHPFIKLVILPVPDKPAGGGFPVLLVANSQSGDEAFHSAFKSQAYFE